MMSSQDWTSTFAHSMKQRIWTAARKEAVLFAKRVAIPCHCLSLRKRSQRGDEARISNGPTCVDHVGSSLEEQPQPSYAPDDFIGIVASVSSNQSAKSPSIKAIACLQSATVPLE